MKRKNILFIMADQLSAAFLNCYGSGLAVSPMLDSLAENGVRFKRCYASTPICAPNRATIFTGRSPVAHGVIGNNYNLQCDVPTLFGVLQKHGYRTGGFGKFHLTTMGKALPDNLNYLGFNESIATEDPKLGPWIDWVKREHQEDYETALSVTWPMEYSKRYGKKHEDLLSKINKSTEKILEPLRKASFWRQAYPSPLRKEIHQTTWITDISLDFMEQHLLTYPDQPFCAYVSYVDPHDPYDPPVPYDTMFDPDEMPDPLPASWEERGCGILEQSKSYLNFKDIENDKDAIKRARALYAGSIRFVDDQIGRIIAFIEERGIRDDTLIVFTSDHGDMLGDHSLPGKGAKHFDKSIHCPLIVSGPGIYSGVINDLVCSLDFFPTFCEFAGVNKYLPPLEGKSFLPLLHGKTQLKPWKEVTVDYCTDEAGFGVRSIVTEDGWRFTVFDEDNTGEMYNLNTDSDEQKNLFHNPKYIKKKLQLYERLTRAYMHNCQIPQYRNLPEFNGVKCLLKPNTMGEQGKKIIY